VPEAEIVNPTTISFFPLWSVHRSIHRHSKKKTRYCMPVRVTIIKHVVQLNPTKKRHNVILNRITC